jgi:two-component system, sensor histidine kinase and response regulator
MAQAAEQQIAGYAAPLPVIEVRPKILIVDDRRENLLATEKILRHLNAGIFNANSGNEALSLVLRHRFAAVLLDVQMPEMDGFETAMLMQEHESMQGVPIIFVTAISKEEKYATRAAEIGAVDYIFKPINSEILRSKVKVYLDLYVQREHIVKLNASLQQSNEELERFAYICSHDLQEPARMMNSYAGILNEKYGTLLDEKGRKYLRFITDNALHMREMILEILAFSRVGREELKLETVDCNQVLSAVLAKFEDVIAKTAAQVDHEPLPTFRTSPTLMHVMFQNLIGNALKFQDGSRAPEISIRSEGRDGVWQFSVEDNGIGISPDFHDKIFTIFQRLHSKKDYPGTGIGLSTCKKFVELCGGAIWFESTPGQGTRFFFTLPQGTERAL